MDQQQEIRRNLPGSGRSQAKEKPRDLGGSHGSMKQGSQTRSASKAPASQVRQAMVLSSKDGARNTSVSGDVWVHTGIEKVTAIWGWSEKRFMGALKALLQEREPSENPDAQMLLAHGLVTFRDPSAGGKGGEA